MSATEASGKDGIGRTVRTGPLVALEPPQVASDAEGPATGVLGRLAEIVLPADDHAPGAGRLVIAHCLNGLASRMIVDEAELLGSELIKDSLLHRQAGRGNTILLSVHLGAETLRVEVEHQRTTWFEMARA